ncbi:hypothetical protein J5N97_019129 [Dioscorea zingiberensis]|uniref:RRM domain-containing protein n=1 Tax=Dioscorea zingiberensis TaxID=325984 RepID=A0A9D5CFC7_9LILI|nr:hypothetical protein J5N97_019129 [Dioscorea zingiberensis]
MAAHQRQLQLGGTSDTTFTKIFVGGLAWETQRDTMRRYFEQFGEILEAVVITDKHTGRSKGYGFVTFKNPDAALRACQDPTPVIDGRRANCNLAALGASTHRPRPQTPHYAAGRFRPAFAPAATSSTYHGSSSTTSAAFLPQPAQYAFPYSVYGYSSGGYSQEGGVYPMGYYGVYSSSQHQQQHHYQFSPSYYTAGPGVYQNLYSYYHPQYTQTGQAHSGYTLHYPQVLQYPYGQQHYGSGTPSLPVSIASATTGINPTAIVGPSSSQQPPGATAAEPKSSA